MSIEIVEAFTVGAFLGVVFGVTMSAIFVAVSNKIEGREE